MIFPMIVRGRKLLMPALIMGLRACNTVPFLAISRGHINERCLVRSVIDWEASQAMCSCFR